MADPPRRLYSVANACSHDSPCGLQRQRRRADQDGSPESEDYNDTNPRVRPGIDEECDELDNDCDGKTDEGVQLELHWDEDGDSFGTRRCWRAALGHDLIPGAPGYLGTGGVYVQYAE